ncbi:MAG: choice-of-anchor D domain-containing protein [Terracidiphilus sp.]
MKQAAISFKTSADRKLGSPAATSQRFAGAQASVRSVIALMLPGAFCVAAGAQTLAPNWVQQSPAHNPGARFESAITYDAAHAQVVLFSGNDSLNNTWLWNGSDWTQASPANSPSQRFSPAMAFDAAHGQVVLFGGSSGGVSRLADTWVWDGANWTNVTPASSPSARNGAVMVYDAAHSQVVLFGGIDNSGLRNDTWVWNGTTWAQLSPAASPSARVDYSMVYDAAHSQVVLFGGQDAGGDQNDTWVWNGTTWTQQIPSNTAGNPPARDSQGMAYNAAMGQTVMFGGKNGGDLDDTWVWNGTNWTAAMTPSSLTARIASHAMTYDAALGQVILYSGISPDTDTWEWGLSNNFGNVNVCPAGQSTPAPCSKTLSLIFNFAADTTITSIQVVTQGAPSLDFRQVSGGNCSGMISAGSSCTLSVQFAPLAPGLRLGALQLLVNGTQPVNIPIYGVGQGPAAAFSPATPTTVNTGSFSLSVPKGVAVDAAGDVFISDNGNSRVVKVAANGTVSTVGSGLNYPQGLAVDGAGDLFIADNNLNAVVEVTPAGVQTIMSFGVVAQLGVAVDGAGDLFIADFTGSEVIEAPAGCTSSACATVVYSAEPGMHPVGLAVDAAGDLFIADFSDAPTTTPGKVVEIPAGCTSSACQTTVGTGWYEPEAIAVDAAGDVFVADEAPKVIEVPAGCVNNGNNCQVTISGVLAYGVAVDGKGNVFIPDLDALIAPTDPDSNQVIVFNRSQPPSLTFAATNVGSTSVDSPRSVMLQNIGNQALDAVNSGLAVNGPDFVEVNGAGTPADCVSAFSLAPGAECNLSISFTPKIAGNPLARTAVFTDNALNASVAAQTVPLSGVGILVAPPTTVVPNVVGQTASAAGSAITTASLTMGTGSSAFSSTVPLGSVISQNPAPGTQVAVGSVVELLVSNGPQPATNPLSLQNNYFVTGDYASAGVSLRGTGGPGGMATGTITIPTYSQNQSQGVPDGADIVEAFLYWETVENTPSASAGSGTFDSFPITGQQIGSDQSYTDGSLSGTLRVYRADVNAYFLPQANGIRFASGTHTVSLPDAGGSAFPLTEGASLVVIYRVLSPNFPLKSVVIYDGSALSANATPQVVQGFYDAYPATGTAKNTNIFAAAGGWNNSFNAVTLPAHASQYTATLNPNSAYAAVIVSTPVTNSDNDGILDAWKTGPGAGDVNAGNPGYYDVKTGFFVPLPGARHGQKDLFVQLDYMCSTVNPDGSCASGAGQENLFPSPDASGKDPLLMVQQAFAANEVTLHLEVGNAVPEDTCTDATQPQLCEFPNEPGVISWKNSLEFSKLWPKNFAACAAGGDCSPRFPYGQKDSYHYVLFGHSLAIPAWNTRYGTLVSITSVMNGQTTIVTADRGAGINACPGRITISGVLGNPNLNGVFNTTTCPDTKTINFATPAGAPTWSYPNTTLPEPIIGLTSGTVTSISGYSDLGGADSAVTLGLWLTAPNQDMSKRANVIAGTLFHEIGHTLGLSHGGLYYDTPGSYIPTFEANCKPNFQSSMNYLFQLDGVGPTQAVAYSNQTLNTLNESQASQTTELVDTGVPGNPATFPTSAWYVPFTPGSTASPATLHCDGTPLNNDAAYRVDAPIAPITPPWSNGQDINFDGQLNTQMRGYNDAANLDLRQVGATGGEFASLASVLSFGSSSAPLNIAAGGTVALGSGGTIALGSGGTVALGSGGNVTLSSGGTIALGSGGTIALGSGGNVTLGSAGTISPGPTGGTIGLSIGGNVTLNSGGTIALGSGGTIALGSGGTVTFGSAGTVTDSTGTTPESAGGTYTFGASGGTIALGSGGTIALGSGGNVTLSSGGTIALGSGGTIALGSGGNVTLSAGGTIVLGSGGTIALGSGGNVTLSSGGTIALGSGGTIALGSGGNVTLASGGTVTLGGGGDLSLGSGGNITLASGGSATVGAGGSVTLGSGGTVALGSGGNITLSSGGTIALGSGGNVTFGSSGGIFTPSGGGAPVTYGPGPTTLATGGTIALGSGGTIALGSGGNVTLSTGGTIALGSGGNVTLGSGGTIALGSGGTIALGSGGTIALGSGGTIALGSGGTIALGSGGNIALGSGGNITLGSGGTLTNELTYETANSIVRPPSSPTETPTPTGPVRIDWTAPAFGVVQTYTIYRSVNGGTPVAIGSVSGNPPATEFIDTNPDTTPGDVVVYTISTTLAPVPIDPTQRQSPPSAPAVLKNDQTIALGPLPSSVVLADPQPTVTATATSSSGLQVNFSATGSCAIGSQSFANAVSSASVTVSATGSCTVTASQPGTDPSQVGNPPYYNAANAVSGTFMVLPQGSDLLSQTITWATLPNAQYGGTFSLIATSSSGETVNFIASGPCTPSGSITGIGVCKITASAPGDSTHSAASVSQSFTIFPAVLKVTATNLTSVYRQPLPTLTFGYSGFVNSETSSVVSGTPSLATTATPASNAGGYPITVSTGTLSAADYSFLYVSGTLTIQAATQAIMFTANPPPSAAFNASFTVVATGGLSGNPVAFTSAGACSNAGATYTMTNSTGTCSVIANQAGNANYAAAPQVTKIVNATGPLVTVSPSNINFGTVYRGSISTKTITVTNIGTAPLTVHDPLLSIVKGGNSNEFIAVNLCLVPLPAGKSCTITIAFVAGPFYTAQTATLQIMDNAPGSPQAVTLSALVIDPLATLSPTSLNFGTVKHGTSSTLNVILSNPGGTPLNFSGTSISVTGANKTNFVESNNCGTSLAAGARCTIEVKFTPAIGTISASLTVVDNAQAGGGTQTVALSGKGN